MRRLVFGVTFALFTFYCLAQTSDWFSGGGRRRGRTPPVQYEAPEVGSWTTDAPKADVTFVAGIKRLTNLDVRDSAFFIPLTSEEIFKYPFLYAVEVGYLQLSDEEAATLREYLLRGGFLVVDEKLRVGQLGGTAAQGVPGLQNRGYPVVPSHIPLLF
jgi:hypothetical protein